MKHALQDNLSILDSRIGSKDLWERLATVAAEFRELARDVFREAETNSGLRRSANYLRLLSRVEPGSDNLANACISVIADQTPRHNWFDEVETAAAILAEQFRGDSRLEDRLMALSTPHHIPTDVVMALSLGWPNNQLLRDLEFDVQSLSMEAGVLYPKYAITPSSQVPLAIESDLIGAQHNSFLVDNIIRPFSARLQNDAELARHLMRTLVETGSPSVKTSFSKLLAFSRGISAVCFRQACVT